jgi:hypothetical protein
MWSSTRSSLGGPKEMGTEKATKAPEGAAAGVTTGGVIGGTLGLLAGVGLLAIPGLGPFIAAGPIMAGLAGLGVGGAVGGVTGALIGMGIPEFEAKRYEGRLQKGGILLSVHCDTSDEIKRAKEVMERGQQWVRIVNTRNIGLAATTTLASYLAERPTGFLFELQARPARSETARILF